MKKLIVSFLIISGLLVTNLWAADNANQEKKIPSPAAVPQTQPVPTEQEVVDFFNAFNLTMFESQSKLTFMHKKGALSKLGKEEVSGAISGILVYDAKVKGLGGEVKMIYTDYSDFEGWVVTGESNVTSRMDMNGKMFSGVKVYDGEGNLICTIDYSNIEIKKGAVGGGFYNVTFQGCETVKLDWDKVIQSPQQ